MEGHAGASRLNLAAADDSSWTEDSSEFEAGADQTSTEVTAEDSSESGVRADQPPDTRTWDIATDSPAAKPAAVVGERGQPRGPSRLGRRWVTGICAVVVLLAAGVATGGYFALRSHHESQAIGGDNAAAIAAAKECVAATQAPDSSALPAAQRKIVECSTGDFAAQAALYSTMLVQAYQIADVHVQVSELRTAVERDNDDGSVDLMVALRIKVDTIQAQNQEYGYRLRVQMARDDGQYKIAKLDQVAK